MTGGRRPFDRRQTEESRKTSRMPGLASMDPSGGVPEKLASCLFIVNISVNSENCGSPILNDHVFSHLRHNF
jgi:hypothetical protein